MQNHDGPKRLKLSNGLAVKKGPGKAGAANLPAYPPAAAIGARGASRYVMHLVGFFVASLAGGCMIGRRQSACCKAACVDGMADARQMEHSAGRCDNWTQDAGATLHRMARRKA